MRFFSVDQANRVIPLLVPVMERLREQKRMLDRRQEELQALLATAPTNGGRKVVLAKEEEASRIVKEIDQDLRRLAELGCLVKDIDTGLVDFPSLYRNREVYLCWKLGEEKIAFWHDFDTGFSGRKPLDASGEFIGGV